MSLRFISSELYGKGMYGNERKVSFWFPERFAVCTYPHTRICCVVVVFSVGWSVSSLSLSLYIWDLQVFDINGTSAVMKRRRETIASSRSYVANTASSGLHVLNAADASSTLSYSSIPLPCSVTATRNHNLFPMSMIHLLPSRKTACPSPPLPVATPSPA